MKKPRLSKRRAGLTVLSVLVLSFAGCAVNPATGRRQLSFISEADEIRMGREADGQIVEALGLYPDSSLQRYVRELGDSLAARSERPNLPWTFRVLDDPVVNAFALPGGFIYITRGILAHMDSEAELAGVLGHEIGHVTARHSVNQMSRAQLAQLGLGVGMVFSPELAAFGDLAGTGLQLMFLKFGRDDERQADELGVRYMSRLDYDPRQLADVMEMLGRTSRMSGGERIPGWLSTHPDPEDRSARIQRLASADTVPGSLVRGPELLDHLDGMVFGANPRDGYFQDGRFFHPDLAFRIDFPAGWTMVNQRSAVQAVSPDEDAVLLLTLASDGTPDAALRSFLREEGIRTRDTWDDPVNGLSAAWADFTTRTESGELGGAVAFISHRETLFRFLGYTPWSRWADRGPVLEGALTSFAPLDDPAVLGVEPARLSMVRLEEELSLQEFLERYPSTAEAEVLALVNQVNVDARLPAGSIVKRVVGGELPP